MYNDQLLFRVYLAESLPIVLKKEYGCHRKTRKYFYFTLKWSVSFYEFRGEVLFIIKMNSTVPKISYSYITLGRSFKTISTPKP